MCSSAVVEKPIGSRPGADQQCGNCNKHKRLGNVGMLSVFFNRDQASLHWASSARPSRWHDYCMYVMSQKMPRTATGQLRTFPGFLISTTPGVVGFENVFTISTSNDVFELVSTSVSLHATPWMEREQDDVASLTNSQVDLSTRINLLGWPASCRLMTYFLSQSLSGWNSAAADNTRYVMIRIGRTFASKAAFHRIAQSRSWGLNYKQ